MIKEKKKNIILIISVFIIYVLFFYFKDLSIIDDAWVSNCAINITNGKIIYKDFNVIITPLYYFYLSLFFKIFGSLKALLISKAIIAFLIFYINSKIAKTQIKNKNLQYLYNLIIFCISLILANDYNVLTLFFMFLTLYIFNLYINDEKNKYLYFIGISIFLICFTKQTVGVILSIIFLMVLFYYLAKKSDKKKILYVIIPILLMSIFFIIYLLVTNSFIQFFDYCLFGIKTFSNKISIIDYINFNYKKCLYVILFFVLILFNIINCKKNNNIFIICFFLLSIGSLLFVYPIFNGAHFIIAAMPTISLFLIFFLNKININAIKNIKYIIYILIILILLMLFGRDFMISTRTSKIETGYYKNIIIDEESYDKIYPIIEYMTKNKDKNFYSIEDCYVATQLMLSKTVDNNFACFLYGNLGTTDCIDVLKKLENKNENNYMYIYNNEDMCFWQTPNEARQYIIDNYTLVDKIDNFLIYKIK